MRNSKIGIIGGAGYTAGELLRLLQFHEKVEFCKIQSSSNAGRLVSDVHKDLFGLNLKFDNDIDIDDLDLVFLCKGHGESKPLIDSKPQILDKKIIDLSTDFRNDLNSDFIYGLPEKNRSIIKESRYVANPGCFATSIQLGLLPFINQYGTPGEIHVSGITGSTGAGQKLSETSHYAWRHSNASVYKALTHQHLNEVKLHLGNIKGENIDINFIPYRGAFTRGIITTSYFNCTLEASQLIELYKNYYSDHPFVHVSEINPDLKMVVNTNQCVLYPSVEKGKAIIISIIDNLIKGASGQAIQNMNLMLGYEESTGLKLKSTYF